MAKSKPEQVILYSNTIHAWEVWSVGRPLAHGSLAAVQTAYPDAPPPTERQHRLAAEDPRNPHPEEKIT